MMHIDPKIPKFDKTANWDGIRKRVHRKFYQQATAVLTVIIIAFISFDELKGEDHSKLYSGTKFEKVVAMETQLEQELELLQDEVVEIKENPRYFALIEQVNNINMRLDECKNQISRNPLNPNFHRVYLSLLKSKRKALEILNEMKG